MVATRLLELAAMSTPLPIAVLVSGNGSNLQALIDAEQRGELGAAIVVVIADRTDAYGIERAAIAGIPTEVVDWRSFGDRAAFTSAVCDAVGRHEARAMVLAGFMRILASEAIERFPNGIINVHPSLLPSFPGAHAVRDALAEGVKVTGVTVHFIDEAVDHGPIIAQEPVTVAAGDDEVSLHARIQAVEHRLLPAVVSAFAAGAIAVDGRRVTMSEGTLSGTGGPS
jgi:phosphoribosylglycinamide formyltransferase-1